MARRSPGAGMTVEAMRANPDYLKRWFDAEARWPDEVLLWTGRPGILRSAFFNFWFFPIGALLSIILLLIWWEAETAGPLRLPEAAVIFGAVWLVSSPLRYGWRARQTAYFITDQRIVLLRKGLFRVHQTDHTAERLSDYRIRRYQNDRGDIRLRLSRSLAANPYQDDKIKWMPEQSRSLIAWSGSGPFALYTDGLWGVGGLATAVAAIDRLKSGR